MTNCCSDARISRCQTARGRVAKARSRAPCPRASRLRRAPRGHVARDPAGDEVIHCSACAFAHPTGTAASSQLPRHSHQHLAEILALEEAEGKAAGVCANPSATSSRYLRRRARDRFASLAQGITLLGREVRDDEAAQHEALAQDREHVRTRHWGRRIVLRDEAADRDAREVVQQRPHRRSTAPPTFSK